VLSFVPMVHVFDVVTLCCTLPIPLRVPMVERWSQDDGLQGRISRSVVEPHLWSMADDLYSSSRVLNSLEGLGPIFGNDLTFLSFYNVSSEMHQTFTRNLKSKIYLEKNPGNSLSRTFAIRCNILGVNAFR
jgi:hypothetical protein